MVFIDRYTTATSKSNNLRTKIGGLDLVYNDGPIKHEQSSVYTSYLGSYSAIVNAPRTKKRFSKSTAQQENPSN